MAYPPTVPSGARINTTPQVDLHPADHLAIHAALTDVVTVLGSDPAGEAADVTARFPLEMPIGVILPYGGSSAPSGWTLCDGTAVPRATYPTLFGIIGTSFGAGDGSTTFNVPNMQNRYPIGNSGTLTLGGTVGSNNAVVVTHNHTQNSHNHSQNAHGHGHSLSPAGEHGHNLGNGTVLPYFQGAGAYGFTPGPYGWNNTGPWNGTGFSASYNAGNAGSHNHTITVSDSTASNNAQTATNNPEGVSGTNANRPESVVVNYIIRLT